MIKNEINFLNFNDILIFFIPMLSKTALEAILICDLILKLYSTVSMKFVSKIPMSSNV
jgi:hypothetical protein